MINEYFSLQKDSQFGYQFVLYVIKNLEIYLSLNIHCPCLLYTSDAADE